MQDMPQVATKQVRLIMVSTSNNNNKFWEGYLYPDDTVVTRWGRVGESGTSKTFPNAGERFLNTKSNEKRRKGYTDQKTVNNTVIESVSKGGLAQRAITEMNISCAVTKEIVEFLAQENVHQIQSVTQLEWSASTGQFTTPLGPLGKSGIDEARMLLGNIGSTLTTKNAADLHELVDKYMMIVPQDVGRRRLTVETIFPDMASVHKQSALLDQLESAVDHAQAVARVKTVGSAERLFDVELTVSDTREMAIINRMFKSTWQNMHACAHLKLSRVFHLKIVPAHNAYVEHGAKIGNVMRLWHGTRAGNMLSILRKGYVIPPNNASHVTGRMFGNGVYFSDQSTKSLNYAYGYWGGQGKRSNRCFMLLNDVAMGKVYEPNSPTGRLPVAGYDSTFAKAGKSGVMNNEMIVYDTRQANPVMLCEFTRG